MKRMDIYWVDLEQKGNIQGGIRPCLIVCNDKACEVSPTLLVVPITSKKKRYMPTHLNLGATLQNASIALFEQILTVNKDQVLEYINKLPEYLKEQADQKMMLSLGLTA